MPKLINLTTLTRPPDQTKLRPWTPNTTGYTEILSHLLDYGYLTRQLLALLLSHGKTYQAKPVSTSDGRTIWVPSQEGESKQRSGGHAANRLTKLWAHGFVTRFFRPTEPGTGSNQYVYALTTKGAQVILSPEQLRYHNPAIQNHLKPKTQYDHFLGLVLWRILWTLATTQISQRLETLDYWLDKAPGNQFPVTVNQSNLTIFPDATIWLKRSKPEASYIHPLFLEFERSHANHKRVIRRFHSYQELLHPDRQYRQLEHVYHQRLPNTAPLQPGHVLFLAASPNHQAQLHTLAQDHVGSGVDFWFANVSQLFDGDDILQPERLFTEPLFQNLKGQSVSLLT